MVLTRISQAILKTTERTQASLITPLEFSELLLTTDDLGNFALSFDVLGQNFLLNSQGLFTFNEVGEPFTLEPSFETSIINFIVWRAATIEEFGI